MIFTKTAAFSPDIKYFACFSSDEELLTWEICNSDFINCKYDSSIHSTCTSIHWVLPQHKYVSPTKSKKVCGSLPDSHLLAVGTIKGDIFLYNVAVKNLYLHLVARHSDAVNDMCFYDETNTFFTCSNDKFIAMWDIATGKQKLKWKAGDSPVLAICPIDENNLLSANTSILWWNISEKCIIKEFSGHSNEIFKLLPVNAVSLNSCYFLSSATNDIKINAWSLNSTECETPVASFVLSDQPQDIDISKTSLKDKPLILSIITKNGSLYLFEHMLNGNLNQPIRPKVSIDMSLETSKATIISTKLSPDSESCVIAHGTNKSNMTFKHVMVKEVIKAMKFSPINGVKSNSSADSNPKVTCFKEGDALISSSRRKLRSSNSISSLANQVTLNNCEIEVSKSNYKNEINIEDPKSCADILLRGIDAENEDAINVILNKNDTEFITSLVQNIPPNYLKGLLSTLSSKLQQHMYFPALSNWLKEILRIHLKYLMQSQDTAENLNYIKKQLNSMKIEETLTKLSVLNGLLSIQTQSSSSEESDSESEKPMEL